MRTVFIDNVERVLVGGGVVTGHYARRIMEVCGRAVWYPYDIVVTSARPPIDFVRYAAQLGHKPTFIVPKGVNPRKLSILDGFGDPKLRSTIRGAYVESYISTPEMYGAVTRLGGHYVGGDPGDSVRMANRKVRYRDLAKDIVKLPPGAVRQGTDAIVREVCNRLHRGLDVKVRLDEAGGGLGNRTFYTSQHRGYSPERIRRIVEGDQPEIWCKGTALIEALLTLRWSPGVTFHVGKSTDSIAFDFLQATAGGESVGIWSPVPPQVCNSQTLAAVGLGLAKRLRREGYRGWADTDLGVDTAGQLIGFECNGRMDAGRHVISLGQKRFGPWREWRSKGIVMKAVYHFTLAQRMSFTELQRRLAPLMATSRRPFGVYITTPPVGDVCGLTIFGGNRDYHSVHKTYQQVLKLVGKSGANQEDHPLFR